MTRGKPDLKIVGDLLATIELCVGDLRRLPLTSQAEFLGDRRNPAAAESLLRRAIQALFDLLRHLISRGHGRASLEYKELARIAGESGLIADPRLREVAFELAGFRNRLVHFYQEITAEELFGILSREVGDLEGLAEELRRAAARLAGT